MQTQTIPKHGFGAGNLVLVLAFGSLLSLMAWTQHSGANFKGLNILSLKLPTLYADGQSANSSAVLGADTVSQSFLSQFDNLKVNTSSDNTIGAVKIYVQQLNTVAAFDKNATADKYVQDLSEIAVPSTLADYQKYFLVEQTLKISMANPAHDPNLDAAYSVIETKLNPFRTQYQKVNVVLP